MPVIYSVVGILRTKAGKMPKTVTREKLSQAIGFAVKQRQQSGLLRKGTLVLTVAGKAWVREHRGERKVAEAIKAFERLEAKIATRPQSSATTKKRYAEQAATVLEGKLSGRASVSVQKGPRGGWRLVVVARRGKRLRVPTSFGGFPVDRQKHRAARPTTPAARTATRKPLPACAPRVISLIAKAAKTQPGKVRPESRLRDDLGMDSLAATDLALGLEEKLGVTIDDDALWRVNTVRDLCTLVAKAQAAA